MTEMWRSRLSAEVNNVRYDAEQAAKKFKARIEVLEAVCGEAYQVIGTLSSDCGRFDDADVIKALDNTSQAQMVHGDVLPFLSKEIVMLKHYIEFFHPGSFVSNSSIIPVEDRNVPYTPEWPLNAYAYRHFSREEMVSPSGELLMGKNKDFGPAHYKGTLVKFEDIEHDPELRILRSNWRGNKYKRVVKTNRGQYFPLEDKDIVLPQE